jgi:secreted PhoX family phosphatase
VLSCEENVQFWVSDDVDTAGRGSLDGRFWKALGTKYGWVMELDPYAPAAPPTKHTALGRFRHENVGMRARDGARVACYMGDDRVFGHVWKFLSRDRYRAGDAHRATNQRLLSAGTLYVARFHRDGTGRWIPLVPETRLAPNGGATQPIPSGATTLGQVYASQGAIVVDAFRAANAVGATPTGRPEDLEVHPVTNAVYVAFTSFVSATDQLFSTRLGELWRIEDDGRDPEATTFTWARFVASGLAPGQGGFAQPDNLMFDGVGNLWVCTDMSPGGLNNDAMPEGAYRNNGLFVIATAAGHPEAGTPRQFASGPCESELTGISHTPDGSTLFVSVQHPGERFGIRGIGGVAAPRGSNWPAQTPGAPPRPGVVAITRA